MEALTTCSSHADTCVREAPSGSDFHACIHRGPYENTSWRRSSKSREANRHAYERATASTADVADACKATVANLEVNSADAAVSAALPPAPKLATTTAPKLSQATDTAPVSKKLDRTAAGVDGPTILSKTDKFRPWFRQLEAELLAVSLEVVRMTTGESVESDAEDVTEEEREAEIEAERQKQRILGPGAFEAEHQTKLQKLGHRMGKLVQLLLQDVLPKFQSDPEVLFLCAAADFTSRKFESSLRAMQTSLAATPEGHCTPRELAARNYFMALIAIRITTEAQDPQIKGDEAKPLRPQIDGKR